MLEGKIVEPWQDHTGWSVAPLVGWCLAMVRDENGQISFVQIKSGANFLASVLVVVGALSTGIALATGGIKFGNTTAVEELTNKVNTVQRTVDEMKNSLNLMPRPSDYAGQQLHLDHLDTSVTTLTERVARDENGAAVVKDRVDRLWDGTQAPIRNPR